MADLHRLVALGAALLLLASCAEKEVILTGERFDPRSPLEASLPTEEVPNPSDQPARSENRSAPIALPGAVANADWGQRGGNAAHLPPHVALSAAPVRVWSVPVGAGNARRNRIAAAPVAGGGRVFAMDAGTRVTAVSPSGAVLWTTELRPDFDASELSGGGLAYGEGRLFATTGFGEIVAIDPASGGIAWRQRLLAPASGAPMVDGGVVYAVGRDGTAWAVRADNGRVVWQTPGTPAPAGVIGAAAPAAAGPAILFPYTSGEVASTSRETGVRGWTTTVAGTRRGRVYASVGDITGDPVVAGGTTYVGNQGGRTVALNTADGTRLWTAREGAQGPVLPVGGSVFLVSDEGRLVRLDAGTGEPVWSVELPGYVPQRREFKRLAIYPSFGPILAGGRLVVASGDGLVRLFSPVDGALVGSVEVPGGAAAPVAAAGGVLYVIGANGQLHAFR
jgi:outer membrane protein assembly factor BamB